MTPSSPDSAAPSDTDLHRQWHEHGRAHFTMLQTGFGDGAQLTRTWTAWQQDAEAPQRLHYLIIDPQLPGRAQLPTLLSLLPSLPQQLVDFWPAGVPGYHRLFLEQGRFTLTLIIGDVAACLPQLDAEVDRFILSTHGEKNPAWTPALLKWLGRLAAPRARLLADDGQLLSRQNLQQIGFVSEDSVHPTPAVFSPRWQMPSAAATVAAVPVLAIDRRAIVIGAGLAGSAACESLTARGWQVDLIEQHAQPAQEASGNLAGVFMPAISRDDNPTARLTRAAFLFAQQVWTRSGVFADAKHAGEKCGVLQVARDTEQAAAFEDAARHWRYPPDYAQWLTQDEASARLGRATGSGWFFPAGGWLRPSVVCEAMLAACGERVRRHFLSTAASLRRIDDEWQVGDDKGQTIAQAPVVILANGLQATQFEQAAGLPLQKIRGQVSHVQESWLPSLPFVLCGDGYLTGAVDGMVSVGASYDQDDDPAVRRDSHLGNLDKLAQLLREPTLGQGIDPATLTGRVGFRCVSADRLPLIGALPDGDALAAAGEVQLKEVPRQPQLYGLLAYASRGLIWAPLAAELLACRLEGEPAPLGKDLQALLDPARFALKAHRQKNR